MSLLPLIGAAIGAILSGAVAWRRTSARLHHRSPNPTIRPPHVALEDYDAWALARRKRQRLLKVAGAAAAGALAGWLVATMLGAGFARR